MVRELAKPNLSVGFWRKLTGENAEGTERGNLAKTQRAQRGREGTG